MPRSFAYLEIKQLFHYKGSKPRITEVILGLDPLFNNSDVLYIVLNF